MNDIYLLSTVAVRIFGPLMAACFIMMYIITANVTGKRPRPREVIYSYARYNLARKKHAGLLTYVLIVSFIFFVLAVLGLLIGHPK